MRKERNKKVIIAISGGIDSSVSAALLKRAGFDVTGVFFRLYDSPSFKRSEKKARETAKVLGISFVSLDLKKEFKEKVIKCFLEELKKGTTPNPCVICNREIKLAVLLKKMKEFRADFVATGHYARNVNIPKSKIQKLLKAKDEEKDQSYFLWRLTQKELKHILFPVGDYRKKEIKSLAKKFKLPAVNAPESQEICFVGKDIRKFLLFHLKQKTGKIINVEGEVIGEHLGVHFYTIGQRKRIGLSGGPWYVLDKDIKKNILTITKKESDLDKKEFFIKNMNWVSGQIPKLPLKVKTKVRYRSPALPAEIIKKVSSKKWKVVLDRPQRAITSGQSAVFYKKQELLGGGIII